MNKTALITGASGGIGLEIARIFARNQMNVILVARSKSRLEAIQSAFEEDFDIKVHILDKDLSNPKMAYAVYEEAKNSGLQVDYLVNNAGMGNYGHFIETDWEKEHQMINLNITALTYLTKLFLKDMVQRGDGKVLNIASTAAFQPGPLMAVYFASKSYVLNFSEAINNEVRPHGVSVTAFCPGPVATQFFTESGMEDSKLVKGKKLPTPEEVASKGYKSMMKGKAVAIPGFLNQMLANSVRLLPRNWVTAMSRSVMKPDQ